jgi:hypothetical protein
VRAGGWLIAATGSELRFLLLPSSNYSLLLLPATSRCLQIGSASLIITALFGAAKRFSTTNLDFQP